MASLIKNVFTQIVSDVTAIDVAIELDKIDATKPHCFVGVQFFTDITGSTKAVPTTGTVAITVRTVNTDLFEIVPDNVIQASAPTTKSWAANSRSIKAVPDSIDVATHYKLVVTCNET